MAAIEKLRNRRPTQPNRSVIAHEKHPHPGNTKVQTVLRHIDSAVRKHRHLRIPSCDAGSCPGNCSGMEEATGAPSSLAFGIRDGCGLPVATGVRSCPPPSASTMTPFASYKTARVRHAENHSWAGESKWATSGERVCHASRPAARGRSRRGQRPGGLTWVHAQPFAGGDYSRRSLHSAGSRGRPANIEGSNVRLISWARGIRAVAVYAANCRAARGGHRRDRKHGSGSRKGCTSSFDRVHSAGRSSQVGRSST